MIEPAKVLSGIPSALRDPLIESYREISSYYLERKWGPAELDGGKFAEIVFTIINDYLRGTISPKPAKPPKMLQACQALEQLPAASTRVGDRSLRVLIPRVLPVLYEVRNNRNVGHVGGDVDPNAMDASAVVALASWIMAELVRIFHNVSIKEAQDTVDALVERKTPLIWEVEPGGIKRVLNKDMGAKDQALLLLHHSTGWVSASELQGWIEYKNPTNFRDKILSELHKPARLIEYDAVGDRAKISPLGAAEVEQRLLKTRP